MILKLLLNIQIIWMKFIKILKNTIQTKNVEYYMIADMVSNKKINPVVNELFIRGRNLL